MENTCYSLFFVYKKENINLKQKKGGIDVMRKANARRKVRSSILNSSRKIVRSRKSSEDKKAKARKIIENSKTKKK